MRSMMKWDAWVQLPDGTKKRVEVAAVARDLAKNEILAELPIGSLLLTHTRRVYA